MKTLNGKTLKLFSAVLKKGLKETLVDMDNGIVVEKGGSYASEDIKQFIRESKLSGNDLNKTFHKSWKVIKESSRYDLLVHQIAHYLSTYGSNFKDEVYIPNEVLELPDIKLKFKVIKTLSKNELIKKCIDILKSGVALKEETLNDILDTLDDLDYVYTGLEGVRNKEALIKIADKYGVYPKDPVEFLRYIVFKSTSKTLLIKDKETIASIKASAYNPSVAFNSYSDGLQGLATIFNRFKPIFLAYKSKCPSVVNKISKLSKTCHEPMVLNELNLVTSRKLTNDSWLKNATVFALFKALNACYTRDRGQKAFTYRIRNGKSHTEAKEVSDISLEACRYNYIKILKFLKKKLPKNKSVFIPDNVVYALPTSEKMFVGSIPTGTKISSKKLNVGVYWKNDWGARDLDLSSVNMLGDKIGWNTSYNHDKVFYSGDVTDAPKGAVEYLRFNRSKENYIVKLNVFSGGDNSDYKIVVGEGDKVSREYMMDPNKVLFETKCTTPQRQTTVGLVSTEDDRSVFTFLNFGSGNLNVSGGGELSRLRIKALFEQWDNSISFNMFVKDLGWDIVSDETEADINLSLDNVDKDTFIKLFEQ